MSSPRIQRLLLLTAFAALLLTSTFFLRGDLGLFSDDHVYRQRDPVSGGIVSLLPARPNHVFRPLYLTWITATCTLLGDHPWSLHLISTLLHAGVGWMLYRLLRRTGVSSRVAAASTAVFLVYPAHFEAVFWISCHGTLIAAGLAAMLIERALRAACQPHAALFDRREFLAGAMFALGGFAVSAFNEQPAGLIAAMPALALLIQRCEPQLFRRSIVRLGIRWVAAVVGILIYRLAMNGFQPREHFAGFSSRQLVGHLSLLAESVPSEAALFGLARGSFRLGCKVVAEHPWHAAVAAAVAIAGIAAIVKWWQAQAASAASDRHRGGLGWRLVVVGLVLGVCSWLPVAVVHADVSSRLQYASDLGMAITLAGVLTMLANILRRVLADRAVRLRQTVAIVLLIACLTCAGVMLIGAQGAFQHSTRADDGEVRQLNQLFPGVPPNVVFVPIAVARVPRTEGSVVLERTLRTAWAGRYSAGWNLQRLFGRDDVFATLVGRGKSVRLFADPVSSGAVIIHRGRLAPPGIWTPQELVPDHPRQARLDWDRVVAFTIDERGEVRPFTRIRVLDERGKTITELSPKLTQHIDTVRTLELRANRPGPEGSPPSAD